MYRVTDVKKLHQLHNKHYVSYEIEKDNSQTKPHAKINTYLLNGKACF